MGRSRLRGRLTRRKWGDLVVDERDRQDPRVLIRRDVWPAPEACDRWDVLGFDSPTDLDRDHVERDRDIQSGGNDVEAELDGDADDVAWPDDAGTHDTLAWADDDPHLDDADLDLGGDLDLDGDLDLSLVPRARPVDVDASGIGFGFDLDAAGVGVGADDDDLLVLDEVLRPVDDGTPLDLDRLDRFASVEDDLGDALRPGDLDADYDPWLIEPWPPATGADEATGSVADVVGDTGELTGEAPAAAGSSRVSRIDRSKARGPAPVVVRPASRFAVPGVHDDPLPIRKTRSRIRR